MPASSEVEFEFSYVPQLWRTLCFFVLSVLLSAFCGWIYLDGGSPLLFGSFAAIFAVAPLIGVPDIVNAIRRRGRVALTSEGVFIPNRPWKTGEAFFTYDSVENLQIVRSGFSFRLVVARDGPDYLLGGERFESSTHFADFYELLMTRCGFELPYEQDSPDTA